MSADGAEGPFIRDLSHYATQCQKSGVIRRHNAIRDIIVQMYKAIFVVVGVECKGLYSLLTTHGGHKPADVLVPPSHTGTDKFWAIDVTIVDPSLPSMVSGQRSHRVPLNAAKDKYRKKMNTHDKAVEQANRQNLVLPFDKYPLVFETTGAYGKETLAWFNSMVAHWKDLKMPSLRDLGLDHTWSAASYESFWSQRLSMAQAQLQAEAAISLVYGSLSPHEVAQFDG